MTIEKLLNGVVFIDMEFGVLRSLLRRRADDASVRNVFGADPSTIVRSAYYGYISHRENGFDVMFKEAPWVVPAIKISDPKDLYVCAFHFHRKGHEGFEGYEDGFPGGVLFGDLETDVLSKLGPPSHRGGGNWSKTLKKRIHLWIRYSIDDVQLRFQFDDSGKVELVTLQCEDLQQATVGFPEL